jgi:glycine C-acetyltransferase
VPAADLRNNPEHVALETELAEYFDAEQALTFASGYAANVGIIPALVGRGDAIFADTLNHASLIDGCRLSRATVHVYPHLDVAALTMLLQEHRGASRRALIVTDGLFSMDGDRADHGDRRSGAAA